MGLFSIVGSLFGIPGYFMGRSLDKNKAKAAMGLQKAIKCSNGIGLLHELATSCKANTKGFLFGSIFGIPGALIGAKHIR